ncbi:4-phosphopantoate--beta-alanine ligase [Haloquadratum walsbyi]|jgi:pantothenate synthetase (EC 6.3.2.1)|uniref:4-phosphopantoate--beta-alanine ligase n=1 Tax=Haloquadratum walsbyi J07HQW2 TaxID=1238425 RepID=U1NGW5_9EURY|nr:4-phosphopantoate--beta-alanine ligase [Haloquadratum walsbyi]ERG96355.1 MAG: uncharacterized protein conserved in archaea [Haloquadratum walsbyi J07HQW2]
MNDSSSTESPGKQGDTDMPQSHPRYQSLITRHRIEEGVNAGITSTQGLIAEGRGEAFDYLLGERTIASADEAARAAAALLLDAEHPVISVNGNVAALVPEAIVELAKMVNADIEVNLFNRTEERMKAIADHLHDHGAETVRGLKADGQIPGLDHERATVDSDGIGAADVVLVPLEDGDRAAALDAVGKHEIVIDLNPLSRSAVAATVPIIDNVLRAVPNITAHAVELKQANNIALTAVVDRFDPDEARERAEKEIRRGELE